MTYAKSTTLTIGPELCYIYLIPNFRLKIIIIKPAKTRSSEFHGLPSKRILAALKKTRLQGLFFSILSAAS